ncbi:hypothetical protein GCM10009556_038240 [Acrocarpospora pleiomorpha]
MRGQRREHTVKGLGEHREPLVRLQAHAHALSALAGEQERRLLVVLGPAAYDSRRRLAGGQRPQPGQRPGTIAGQHRGPVLERGTGGRQRERHVGQVRLGTAFQVGQQPRGLLPHRLFRLARDR